MTVTGPGGVSVSHFSPMFVYDPSTGAIGRVRLAVDGRFLGGSAGTSQFALRPSIRQGGTIYIPTGSLALEAALGSGNGMEGPWYRLEMDALSASEWVAQTGSPGTPDFSTSGSPIQLGYLTTVSESQGNTLSITGGVDRLAYTIIGLDEVDLKIAKNASPVPAIVGSNLTYTITVTNAGPGAASNVVVTDTVPPGTIFVSTSTGCVEAGGTVTCNLGALADGQSTNVVVVVTPTVAGTVTNTASVTADQADVFPSDNSDTDPVAVNEPVPMGDDLTVDVSHDTFDCVTTKATTCTTTGTLSLLNNDAVYGMAEFSITATDSTKAGKPPKWKLAFQITSLDFDLGANPSAKLNFYLSDDAVFDGSDTPLLKPGKEPTTTTLDALAQAGKVPKLKFSIPKSTDLSGKHILAVIDFDDQVTETNDDNNTSAIGPIP
jgi:uncharacterized repeat protein (TIGR01451 family)